MNKAPKQITEVRVDSIYLSHKFNCRNQFDPSSVAALAADIKAKGLLQPIVVRELRQEQGSDYEPETDLIEQGFKYHLISGHRRLTACRTLQMAVIPAIVWPAQTSEFDCKDINANENLHRAQLTFAEECEAIRHYWQRSYDKIYVANRLNKSVGWVATRYMGLEMPKQVLDWADKDELIAADIQRLYRYRDDEEKLLRGAMKARERRIAGRNHQVSLAKEPDKYNSKRARKRKEIQALIWELQEVFKNADLNQMIPLDQLMTKQGNSLVTRVLAWASGEISTGEMYDSVNEFAVAIDHPFEYPELQSDD